jgi:pimeloyl-ACP methyl ester carboxylesterase
MTGSPAGPAEANEELGGRLVHWVRRGSGRPPVLLLGGCGVPSTAWEPLLPALDGYLVVQLDRPGLLGTPWPGVLPTLEAEVATLTALVERVGGPVVVVAHSLAGLHAEALVRRRPDLVRGLVLVDSSIEWRPARTRTGSRTVERCWLGLARLARTALRLPPIRLLGSAADRLLVTAQSNRRLLDRRPSAAYSVYRNGEAVASVIAEQAAYERQISDLAALRTASSLPDDLAVVVVTAGSSRRWIRKQAPLAALLGGRQMLAADAHHLVMMDRPDLLADAVREVAGLTAS